MTGTIAVFAIGVMLGIFMTAILHGHGGDDDEQ